VYQQFRLASATAEQLEVFSAFVLQVLYAEQSRFPATSGKYRITGTYTGSFIMVFRLWHHWTIGL